MAQELCVILSGEDRAQLATVIADRNRLRIPEEVGR
jgi:hypothetical protein